MIPYGRQDIREEDVKAVLDVLKSDFLTQGPCVPKLEQALADYCDVPHVQMVNSATSALHIVYLALGLGTDDRLWTVPNSFVATANAALYCGANVDFVDTDPETYNISVESLRNKLETTPKTNHPKIVSVVHFAGQSCDMAAISNLAKKYNFFVVEDASHAIGGSYRGKKVGGCQYSDAAVFSFHPVKIITTAEGGAILTRNSEIYKQVNLLHSHGVTRDSKLMRFATNEPWYYEQVELGFNYRMTEIQAALGASQLLRIDEYINRRHEIFQIYNRTLADLPIKLPFQADTQHSALHLYPIQILPKSGKTRKEVFDSLRQAGIGVNVHYIPIHTQPWYQDLGFKFGDFPESETYYSRAISLPIFPNLSETDQVYICEQLKTSLSL